MPSRRRKFTAISTRRKRSSKSTQSSITTSQSSNEKVTVNGKEVITELAPNKLWKIRDILEKDEKTGKYLIDWEDDPVTKEKYPRTWEPEHFLNAEAFGYWKKKDSASKLSKARSHRIEQRSKRRNTVTHSSPRHESEAVQQDSLLSEPTEVTDGSSNLLTKSTSIQPPGLAVQISPHASLDPQQFPRYSSSLPISVDQASSGLEKSSPSASTPALTNGIVPDSQSTEGSSDFVIATESITSTDLSQTLVTREAYSNAVSNSESSSSGLPFDSSTTTISDPIEDFSSQQPGQTVSLESSYRSKSLPFQSSEEDLILDRHSEPASNQLDLSAIEHGIFRISGANFNHPTEIRHPEDQFVFFGSSVVEPFTQGANLATGGFENTQFQKAATQHRLDYSPRSSVIDDIGDQAAQIQAPTNFHIQESETAYGADTSASKLKSQHSLQNAGFKHWLTIANVEGPWQSGQGLINFEPAVSQELSFDTQHDPGRLTSIRAESSGISESTTEGDSPVQVVPNAGSQVLVNYTQASDATVSPFALTQRDPNSQPEKVLHSAQLKEDVALSSIEQPDYILEDISGSAHRQISSQLQEAFTFSTPPKQTASFDPIMSEKSVISSALKPSQPREFPTSPGGPSIREKLRSMRAATNAVIDSSRTVRHVSPIVQSTKSPSLIPQPTPKEPIGDSRLEVQSMEIPLPLRDSHTDDHVPIHHSNLSIHKEMSQIQVTKALDSPRLGDMEFIIPLPAPARVRDQYVHTINHHRKAIMEFSDTNSVNDELIEKVKNLLRSLDNISIHLDLENDSINTQQSVSPEDEATWAKSCSGKFQFLDHLITWMRNQDEHIAIVAQGGRLLDIIEGFLKGVHVTYNRPDILAQSDHKTTKGRLRFSLIASGEEESSALLAAASLVVAFDGSFNAGEDQIVALRSHMLNIGQLAPVIYLIIYASSEHIERCIPDSIVGVERLRAMVSCVAHARQEVGELLPEEFAPIDAAEEVMEFVKAGGLSGQWVLPSIRPLEIDGVELVDSSQDLNGTTQANIQASKAESIGSQASKGESMEPQISKDEGMGSQAVRKRSLDTMEDITASPKRQRLTPVPEVTHVSHTATQESQRTTIELRDALQELQESKTELFNVKAFYSNQEASMKAKIAELEARLEEHIDAVCELQRRYEKRNEAYHTLRHEKTDLIAAGALLDRKRESQALEIVKLQEDRRRLEMELQESRSKLLNSVVPQTADLEKARMEARNAVHESSTLRQRFSSLQTDFDYMRSQYSDASAAAANSGRQIQALEAENKILRQKASGEAARLRELNGVNASKVHLARIKELEAIVEDREETLRKREREKRERGVQTRSGSVQREKGSRAGSRAGSPMPGFLGVGEKRASGLRFG